MYIRQVLYQWQTSPISSHLLYELTKFYFHSNFSTQTQSYNLSSWYLILLYLILNMFVAPIFLLVFMLTFFVLRLNLGHHTCSVVVHRCIVSCIFEVVCRILKILYRLVYGFIMISSYVCVRLRSYSFLFFTDLHWTALPSSYLSPS